MSTAVIDFVTGRPVRRDIDVAWIHGSPSTAQNTDPEIQVFDYDEHTVILRQSMSIDREAPFLFLLFGNTRAVLIDTGATAAADVFPLRRVVDELVKRWTAAHPRPEYGLLILHSHAHYDHIAGDGQFAGRPHTEIVGANLRSVGEYFGFADNPWCVANVDLGGRVLECLATPGHHETAVTYYDPYDGLLLTGDTVYPGRLYVNDWPCVRRHHRSVAGVLRRPPGRASARLPHRDDDDAASRLPGGGHLPAGRSSVADDGRAAARHSGGHRPDRPKPRRPAGVRRLHHLCRHRLSRYRLS